MTQFILIVVTVLLLAVCICGFIIYRMIKKLKQYKNDIKCYQNSINDATKQIKELYKLMQDKEKINDWKEEEKQKSEEDVLNDIININNNRVSNN